VSPKHLVQVDNVTDGTSLLYAYEGATGSVCGGSPGQMCSARDPRLHTTSFSHASAGLGPNRIATLTDRNGNVATFNYQTGDYVTVDEGTHRHRFESIDTTGRVGIQNEGGTDDSYLHQYF